MAKDTDSGFKGERDWPKGHPASTDYYGQAYTPPPPPFATDWPVGHPARVADTPAPAQQDAPPVADAGTEHAPEPEE